MTQKYTISPFEGEPRTWTKTDQNGQPIMLVRICEMTPERVPWADGLGDVFTLLLVGLSFYILQSLESVHLLVWAGGLIGPLFLRPCLAWLFHWAMAKEKWVMFTPTEFRVQTLTGWRVYDRTLTHRFVMMKHDRTREERDRHEAKMRTAQRSGRIIQPKPVYGESFHIIFEYLGQRIDVATIYRQPRATAVAARLKACDKVMDTQNKMGEGEVLKPAEQWGNMPGTLPDV